jgi:hypothetical protein
MINILTMSHLKTLPRTYMPWQTIHFKLLRLWGKRKMPSFVFCRLIFFHPPSLLLHSTQPYWLPSLLSKLRIRIRMFLSLPDPDPSVRHTDPDQKKNSKKKLGSYCDFLWLFFSLKNDVNVASKSNIQKNSGNFFFSCHLKCHLRK